jgi:hypothetical protein
VSAGKLAGSYQNVASVRRTQAPAVTTKSYFILSQQGGSFLIEVAGVALCPAVSRMMHFNLAACSSSSTQRILP